MSQDPRQVPWSDSYDEWRADAADPAFSEWLRSGSEPGWTAVVTHPFAASITGGLTSEEDMRRYLVQDFQFVDAFTALLGAAVASADSFESRVPFGRFLGETATTEEKTYFHRALAALGASEADLTAPALEPVTVDFRALMDEARRSLDYPVILAVLCVAEWSYLGWASLAEGPPPDNFVHREWVELHEGPAFRAWVAFLRGELDRLGPALDARERARVLDVFRRAVRLEQRFFDMAAGGPESPPAGPGVSGAPS